MLLDWQLESWRLLLARRPALPHALLFRGPKGIGKLQLATLFARSLLCEALPESSLPCLSCLACRWTGQGTHPDLRVIEPDSETESEGEGEPKPKSTTKAPSTQLRIAQIRALQEWVIMSSHRNGLRIAILAPAEAMNASTANALLKTLEEPPPRTLIMLVSNDAAKLLPTIVSRCQRVDLPMPTLETGAAWLGQQGIEAPLSHLALAGGAPLDVLDNPARRDVGALMVKALNAHYNEPLSLATAVKDLPVPEVIDLLQKWAFDLMAARFELAPRYYIDHRDKIDAAAGSLDALKLMRWIRELAEARSLASHPLNPRLVFEKLFQGYRDAFVGGEPVWAHAR